MDLGAGRRESGVELACAPPTPLGTPPSCRNLRSKREESRLALFPSFRRDGPPMKIRSIAAYAQFQPFRDGPYTCSGGRSADGFDSTIVRIDTDEGLVGWGEMAPLGAFYDPSFAGGARAGLRELAPLLVGRDAAATASIGHAMDLHLNGHPYIKSAIDMACWDLAAQAAGRPLYAVLGGAFGTRIPLYRSISQDTPEKMAAGAKKYAAEGYRRIQVKVGLSVHDDIERINACVDALPKGTVIFADANAAWSVAQAREFLRATRDLDYALEQPCRGYEAHKTLRGSCDRPLILDETMTDLAVLLRAHADGVVDGITIKIARVGGVSRARLMRDVAVEMGLRVTIEDTGGAEIDTAAMAHLMLSTPEEARQHTVDFHNWVSAGHGAASFDCRDGSMAAPQGPGLGVAVEIGALGEPFFVTPGA
jgi:cis-L-3-hydroxyproline dehydratase